MTAIRALLARRARFGSAEAELGTEQSHCQILRVAALRQEESCRQSLGGPQSAREEPRLRSAAQRGVWSPNSLTQDCHKVCSRPSQLSAKPAIQQHLWSHEVRSTLRAPRPDEVPESLAELASEPSDPPLVQPLVGPPFVRLHERGLHRGVRRGWRILHGRGRAHVARERRELHPRQRQSGTYAASPRVPSLCAIDATHRSTRLTGRRPRRRRSATCPRSTRSSWTASSRRSPSRRARPRR